MSIEYNKMVLSMTMMMMIIIVDWTKQICDLSDLI